METLDICVATYSLTKGNGIDVTVAEFARELSKYHNVKLAVITANMEVEGVRSPGIGPTGPGPCALPPGNWTRRSSTLFPRTTCRSTWWRA